MTQLHRFGQPRRGTVAAVVVLLMTTMMGMAAFVIDIGILLVVKSQTQAVADAAALAGAKGFFTSVAEVETLAIACAKLNTVNGQSVVLTNSNIAFGTWNPTALTFTVLTGSAASAGNACQITVSATVNLLFAPVLGIKNATVSSSAIAGVQRWDVVLVVDISSSFGASLPNAITGMQDILSAFNQYSSASYVGVVTFNGQTFSTYVPAKGQPANTYVQEALQPVGTNYAALKAAIASIKDCSSSGAPPCSGSDLAVGMKTAVSLFSASGYNPPMGTRKAIIFISDGASNMEGPSGSGSGYSPGCYFYPDSDATDNALTATEAANAWSSQAISVFSILYSGDGAGSTDIAAMRALAPAPTGTAPSTQGFGVYLQEPNPAQLAADLQNLILDNFVYQLLQ